MSNVACITSRAHPVVKNITALHRRKGRAHAGLFWAEGCFCVCAALDAGTPLKQVVVSSDAQPAAAALAERAAHAAIPLIRMSPSCFAKCSVLRHPEGIGAVVPLLPVQPLPATVDSPVMVFWQLQDPGNQGCIVRTCLAIGCSTLVFVQPGVDVFHPMGVRATSGALFRARISLADETTAVAWLDAHAPVVAALSADGACPLATAPAQRTRVLIVGNEPHGLPATVKNNFSTLAIPVRNDIDSLNVTAAAAIAAYTLWAFNPCQDG